MDWPDGLQDKKSNTITTIAKINKHVPAGGDRTFLTCRFRVDVGIPREKRVSKIIKRNHASTSKNRSAQKRFQRINAPVGLNANGAYNNAVTTTLKGRLLRAGSWHVLKRTMKLIPVAGSVFAVGLAGYEIKKKGLIPGVAHVSLDVIPVIGATKNVIEIFTGDLIPDKKTARESVLGESVAAEPHSLPTQIKID